MYSIAYVTECIRQNALLPSLEAFTLGLPLGGEGHENPLDLTLGLQPKREWSNMEISETDVKAEDVKDEYMEIDLPKEEYKEPKIEDVLPKEEYKEPEAPKDVKPIVLPQKQTRPSSKGLNVVNRVAKSRQKKHGKNQATLEPSDVRDEKTCEHCEREFEDGEKLKMHIGAMHSAKYHNCHHCSEGFRRKFILESHTKEVHKDEMQACKDCAQVFNLSREKEQTRKKSQSISPSQDEEYEVDDPSPQPMMERAQSPKMRKEPPTKSFYEEMMSLPWKCKDCGRIFKRANNMNQHIKLMHKGIKPKICQICSEAFSTKPQLTSHMLVHPEFKVPFPCQFCSKPFGDLGRMNKHVSIVHTAGQHE